MRNGEDMHIIPHHVRWGCPLADVTFPYSGWSHTPASLRAFKLYYSGAWFRALGGDDPRETGGRDRARTACKRLGLHTFPAEHLGGYLCR